MGGTEDVLPTVTNILINVVDFNLDIQQAVNAPRLHHQWIPDRLVMERNRFSPDTINLLFTRVAARARRRRAELNNDFSH
jgi:gamma-glutamyltranspeptidase / glutathione hydrolase